MPRVPKWLGDAMESVLASKYLTVRVSSVTLLTDTLCQLNLSGDFQGLDFHPGYAIDFRVNDNDFRHYTPSAFDAQEGTCEILIHLHGNGPGSDFISRLKVGEVLKMVIPRGRKLYQPDHQFHFFFGDETALGLFKLLREEIHAADQHYTGVLELSEENLALPARLGMRLKTVTKNPDDPGRYAAASLHAMKTGYPHIFHQGIFYLIGNAASIQHVKRTLRHMGVAVKNIRTEAYWMKGKAGL
ncbi:putative iron transport/utilisation related protein [Pedobacter sp. BAL39]|uniref:siderophore-interacting protein n=1 Tax=Pedobacter sp. BAL39 TaxID=391596 RepID=UPI00015598E0|nr:siderophore-interacting protein [Pedobacter sp. BAL39]EDM37289.1 putative iron transport/utilisation related protein [Pedobacter sp. BAL39]